jgi:hypothetical protein
MPTMACGQPPNAAIWQGAHARVTALFPPGQQPPSNPRLQQLNRRRAIIPHIANPHTGEPPVHQHCVTRHTSVVVRSGRVHVAARRSVQKLWAHALRGRATAGLLDGWCRLHGSGCSASASGVRLFGAQQSARRTMSRTASSGRTVARWFVRGTTSRGGSPRWGVSAVRPSAYVVWCNSLTPLHPTQPATPTPTAPVELTSPTQVEGGVQQQQQQCRRWTDDMPPSAARTDQEHFGSSERHAMTSAWRRCGPPSQLPGKSRGRYGVSHQTATVEHTTT